MRRANPFKCHSSLTCRWARKLWKQTLRRYNWSRLWPSVTAAGCWDPGGRSFRQHHHSPLPRKEKENFEVAKCNFKVVPAFFSWSHRTKLQKWRIAFSRCFWKIKLDDCDGIRINNTSAAFLGILLDKKKTSSKIKQQSNRHGFIFLLITWPTQFNKEKAFSATRERHC